MVKLASAFSRLNSVKVLVIGDLMLDTYTIGKARRISPEAPVAVVQVLQEDHRPGGSGNVVLNLLSLGAQTSVIGRIGNDWGGECLCKAFEKEGVDTKSIIIQEKYKTPIKNRIISDGQQIVRVDHEQVLPLPELLEQMIIDTLPTVFQDIDIIAISDYGKGFLTSTLLHAIITKASELNIPVIADPKGHDFSKYRGTTLIKPNLSEAYAAANLPAHAPLETAAKAILKLTDAKTVMITRSEAGISMFHSDGMREDFPVQAKQVKDVTGAGDTVLAMLTVALANELSFGEAAQLCNIAASIAIEQMGCARVSLADLAHRLLERDASHKVFDEDHIFALQEVLKGRQYTFLKIDGMTEITQPLFRAIKKLAAKEQDLLVFVNDRDPDEAFIEFLASLQEVKFILLHPESLRLLCNKVPPTYSYLFEGKEFREIKNYASMLYSGLPQISILDAPKPRG